MRKAKFILVYSLRLLFGLLVISSVTSSFSIRAMQANATPTAQVVRTSSFEDPANNNIASDLNADSGISIIGHNNTFNDNNNNSNTTSLIGRVKVSSLPNITAPLREPQPHMIPFHPRNPADFASAKRQAELGLTKPSVDVSTSYPYFLNSSSVSINQTKK